jgi:hypothetical protein
MQDSPFKFTGFNVQVLRRRRQYARMTTSVTAPSNVQLRRTLFAVDDFAKPLSRTVKKDNSSARVSSANRAHRLVRMKS